MTVSASSAPISLKENSPPFLALTESTRALAFTGSYCG